MKKDCSFLFFILCMGLQLPLQGKDKMRVNPSEKISTCVTCADLKSRVDDYVAQHGAEALDNLSDLTLFLNNTLGASRTQGEVNQAMNKCDLYNPRLNFSQINSYVTFGDQPQYHVGTANFTVEAWISYNADISTGLYPIVANENHFSDGTWSGFNLAIWEKKMAFFVMDGTGFVWIESETLPYAGAWHHIVAERIGNQAAAFKIYVDGVLTQTTVRASSMSSGDINSKEVTALKIGSRAGSFASESFSGEIKEVRVYKRLLSENEIQSSYGGCSALPTNTMNSCYGRL
jgi:hypothetical protein